MEGKVTLNAKPGRKGDSISENKESPSYVKGRLLNDTHQCSKKITKGYRSKEKDLENTPEETMFSPAGDKFGSAPESFFNRYSSFSKLSINSYSILLSNMKNSRNIDKREPTFKERKHDSSTNLPKLANENGGEVNSLSNNNNAPFNLDYRLEVDSVLKQSLPSIYNISGKVELSANTNHPYPMRSSLFPNVPPYLIFTASGNKLMEPQREFCEALVWKIYDHTPTIVLDIVRNSGFTLTESDNLWLSTWRKQLLCQGFYDFKENQKVNHFPGTFHLGRKDRLWLNIMKMQRLHGRDKFSFMPQTFLLPKNTEQLRETWFEAGSNVKWIVKPPAAARGEGIKVLHRWSDIPKRDRVIVQRYISQPYLIKDTKFDLRLYVLVTSFDPLRLYVYEDGLVRFASEKYSTSFRNLGENFIHLTNYNINCTNLHYTNNENENLPHGHKWSLKCLWSHFIKNGIDHKKIWLSLIDVVIKTVISCENPIDKLVKVYAKNRYCCYELFGFDIMLDHSLKPWLLEVNISPSLHTDTQLDLKIKSELVTDMFNIMGLHTPEEIQLSPCSRLKLFRRTGVFPQNVYSWNTHLYTFDISRDDEVKQSAFKNNLSNGFSILKNLTSADVKQLVQSEDELARCGSFVRIFPTKTSSSYLPLFEKPKYYNILLDAWERRYDGKRENGILFLQPFCEQGMHIQATEDSDEKNELPSVLLKENSKARKAQGKFACSTRNQNGSSVNRQVPKTRKLRGDNQRVKVSSSVKNKRKQNCQLKKQKTVTAVT